MKATTRSIEESLQDIRLETLNDKEIALEKVTWPCAYKSRIQFV